MSTIRPFEFTTRDYEIVASLRNQVWPDYPDTPAELREHDHLRPKKVRWARFLLEENGEAVGLGTYSQDLSIYHPRKFSLSVNVVPGQRRRGFGEQLWQHLCKQLAPFAPTAFFTQTREDYTDGMTFATKRGFVKALREWESRLDPSTVELDAWRHYEERAAQNGIEFKTVADLRHQPGWAEKLHALQMTVEDDIPNSDTPTWIPFDEWVRVFERSDFLPDGWFVAVHGDEFVGTTILEKSEALPNVLYTGLTGVLRAYRKRGIASGLKVQAIRYAQQRGIREVRTWNEENNLGMLGINTRLGFVRQPAHIEFVNRLRPEEEATEAESAIEPATPAAPGPT